MPAKSALEWYGKLSKEIKRNAMFHHRSHQQELMDGGHFTDSELHQNLDEIARCNRWFGSKRLLLQLLQSIYLRQQQFFHTNSIVLADIGCGRGDLLSAIHTWASPKKISIKLMGIDNNQKVVAYAKKQRLASCKFGASDIFSEDFRKQSFDIVTLNSVCHHLSTLELTNLLIQLKRQTRLAIIINDLHRHPLAYFAIKFITKLFNFSKLSQHDGPLSVLRAFTKSDLQNILYAAEIRDYQIKWAWPFRWGIIINCQ